MINASTRRLVQVRADSRCEYCRIHQDDDPYVFHVEHVIPRKHDGGDEPGNLAWSCHNCNLAKSSNLSGWLQGEIVPLFNPRRQNWSRHFRWHGPLLMGRTKCGRTTIQVLNINSDDRVYLRRLLIKLGSFPPT